MSGCQRFKDFLEQYVAGEAAPSELEVMREHANSCADCRYLMELHEELSLATEEVPQPSEAHFQSMRAAVLRQIPREGHRATERKKAFGGFWRSLWAQPVLRPALAFILVVALIGGGFLVGRLSAEPPVFDETLMVQEINRQASLDKGLAGYWDSPFVYSNVKFRPHNGAVALSFDVTRHMDLETAADSPLAREIMLHAILDPSAMGSRLDAIELAPRTMDAKLKEVLVFTLLNDPSFPVRLKALEVLARYAKDPAVQDALLLSIGQDPSVQIRFLALEFLAGQGVDPDSIRRAIGEVSSETDRAVLRRVDELTGGLY
jgi:hypothetical protein